MCICMCGPSLTALEFVTSVGNPGTVASISDIPLTSELLLECSVCNVRLVCLFGIEYFNSNAFTLI